MPQIAIAPLQEGFAVFVDGHTVRYCGDELDAHHWGMHAFEAVNAGLRRPKQIEYELPRICITATRFRTHR